MDIWQTASPDRPVTTGWLGRWLDSAGGDPLLALNVGSTLPPLVVGERACASALSLGEERTAGSATLAALAATDPADSPAASARLCLVCRVRRRRGRPWRRWRRPAPPRRPRSAARGGPRQRPGRPAGPGRPVHQGRRPHPRVHGLARRLRHARRRARLPAEPADQDGRGADRLPGLPWPGTRASRTSSSSPTASSGAGCGPTPPTAPTTAPPGTSCSSARGCAVGSSGTRPSLTQLVDGDLAVTTDFRAVYAAVLEHVLQAEPERVLGSGHAALPLFA